MVNKLAGFSRDVVTVELKNLAFESGVTAAHSTQITQAEKLTDCKRTNHTLTTRITPEHVQHRCYFFGKQASSLAKPENRSLDEEEVFFCIPSQLDKL